MEESERKEEKSEQGSWVGGENRIYSCLLYWRLEGGGAAAAAAAAQGRGSKLDDEGRERQSV